MKWDTTQDNSAQILKCTVIMHIFFSSHGLHIISGRGYLAIIEDFLLVPIAHLLDPSLHCDHKSRVSVNLSERCTIEDVTERWHFCMWFDVGRPSFSLVLN